MRKYTEKELIEEYIFRMFILENEIDIKEYEDRINYAVRIAKEKGLNNLKIEIDFKIENDNVTISYSDKLS